MESCHSGEDRELSLDALRPLTNSTILRRRRTREQTGRRVAPTAAHALKDVSRETPFSPRPGPAPLDAANFLGQVFIPPVSIGAVDIQCVFSIS